ncbi:GRB10-interacting GYF protein 2-like [Amblyraja radiata]|uniref:GRB10-interacting GYF protein 2-like n=1 Tax=Amblyraja radiata TaxID=386614 RepID=UPI001402FD52|nr:GRB10-interacting GYF protein 2-like [Amblyraja radiata]
MARQQEEKTREMTRRQEEMRRRQEEMRRQKEEMVHEMTRQPEEIGRQQEEMKREITRQEEQMMRCREQLELDTKMAVPKARKDILESEGSRCSSRSSKTMSSIPREKTAQSELVVGSIPQSRSTGYLGFENPLEQMKMGKTSSQQMSARSKPITIGASVNARDKPIAGHAFSRPGAQARASQFESQRPVYEQIFFNVLEFFSNNLELQT